MNLTDPVADFLTRIRNSIRARHQKLDVPASRLKSEIEGIKKELAELKASAAQSQTASQSVQELSTRVIWLGVAGWRPPCSSWAETEATAVERINTADETATEGRRMATP